METESCYHCGEDVVHDDELAETDDISIVIFFILRYLFQMWSVRSVNNCSVNN